jgi:hypothetical protein
MSLFYLCFIYILVMKLNQFILILLLSFTSVHSQFIKKNPSINADKEILRKHINILGSDQFEGRGTGTRGGELAATYISEVYRDIGLTPIGDDKTYFQKIPMHGTNIIDESRLFIQNPQDTFHLKIRDDYLLSNFGEQTIIPSALELSFVGYGIIAPEFDHNDYLEKNLIGKIAVILDGEPYSEDPDYFNGDEPTIYNHVNVKHRIAISRGAAGTIIIPHYDYTKNDSWNRLVSEYSFEDVRLSYNASNTFSIILNPKTAALIFFGDSTIQISDFLNFSHLNEFNLKFDGQFIVRDFKASNIVGMIEGSKKSEIDEYIIISAHYDHLGIGPSVDGDKIYNGVLDNAMGVAALLETARILFGYKDYLERSIIFIATTGEEKGLLGSTYYVDHPIFPLYKSVANINIDGVAFLDEFNSIIGVGSELSNLDNYLNLMDEKFNITVKKMPKEFYSNEAFNRSDQIAFAKAGIPSILILDAPEYKSLSRELAVQKIIYYNEEIYHTPFDDLNIQINFKAASQHVNIIAALVFEISSLDKIVEWKDNVPYNYTRLQTIAEKR